MGRTVLLATLAGSLLLGGCGDSITRNSWTSFTVLQAEAFDPDGAPVAGVTVILRSLGLDCDDLRVGSVAVDSVRTDADGEALLGVSVESGPLGDACLGLEVRAPATHLLDGPAERELPVRFTVYGQQPAAPLELLLLPAEPVSGPF